MSHFHRPPLTLIRHFKMVKAFWRYRERLLPEERRALLALVLLRQAKAMWAIAGLGLLPVLAFWLGAPVPVWLILAPGAIAGSYLLLPSFWLNPFLRSDLDPTTQARVFPTYGSYKATLHCALAKVMDLENNAQAIAEGASEPRNQR